MIRTASAPGNACAACTFPKAAMPGFQALAAIALHGAKRTCTTAERAPACGGLHAPPALAADSARAGISRATMNAKASCARRAAVKIAMRSPRSTCNQAPM